MVITIETTFSPGHATRALLLPLIVKHGVTNLLQAFAFGHLRVVGQVVARCDWWLSVLRDCSSLGYRFFFGYGRLSRGWAGSVFNGCKRRRGHVLVRHLHVVRCSDRRIPNCQS